MRAAAGAIVAYARPLGATEPSDEIGGAEDDRGDRDRSTSGNGRMRQPADHPRAQREVCGQPPVDPREQGGQRRRDRSHDRRDERDPEERGDDWSSERVRRDRVERNDSELREQDRRRCEPARPGDRDDLGERVRHRVPRQRLLEARDDDEDRPDGRERELEAGVQERVRAPGQQGGPRRGAGSTSDRSASTQARPARRARPRLRPGRRTAASRLRARSRTDRRERHDLSDEARQSDQIDEQDRAARDQGRRFDRRPRVGGRAPTRGSSRVTRPRVPRPPEHDSGDHCAPLAVQSWSHPADRCARSRSAKPDRPPRRPTIRHRSARTTTCTP